MESTQLNSAACTHIGRRLQNEDSLLTENSLGVYAVADGMGGQAGGEVASKLAIGALLEVYEQAEDGPGITWPLGLNASLGFDEAIAELAVRRANQSVLSHRKGLLADMGSTVALIAIRNDKAILAHVGDSRVYRLRDGELTQLTRDHSFYNDLIAAGVTDLPPRSKFAYNNIITRCLGHPKKGLPDVRTVPVEPGDVFLLCTDGLIECLSDDDILDILESCPTEDAVYRLVEEAFRSGCCDNITAVLVEVEDDRAASKRPIASHPYATAKCA